MVGSSVGGEHTDRTGVAHDRQPSPGRGSGTFLQVEVDRGGQVGGVACPPDAESLEERVDDAGLVRERTGVRGGRPLTSGAAAAGQRDDRHAPACRHVGELLHRGRAADVLEVEDQ